VSTIAPAPAVVVTITVKIEDQAGFAVLVAPAAPGQLQTVTIKLLVTRCDGQFKILPIEVV
jgi:hypothetical protein